MITKDDLINLSSMIFFKVCVYLWVHLKENTSHNFFKCVPIDHMNKTKHLKILDELSIFIFLNNLRDFICIKTHFGVLKLFKVKFKRYIFFKLYKVYLAIKSHFT